MKRCRLEHEGDIFFFMQTLHNRFSSTPSRTSLFLHAVALGIISSKFSHGIIACYEVATEIILRYKLD